MLNNNISSESKEKEYESSLYLIIDIYTYEKENEETIRLLNERLKNFSSSSYETKIQLLPILFGIYVIMNEDYPKLAKIIFDYIKEEVKISKQFGHLIILNILSCKNCYKKHIDMKDLQNIIIQFFRIWEENEKKEIKENNKTISNVKNIYTPIFGVYNNIEQLVKKNLTKLDNIKELYQEEGKIKWNQLLLNKRKNEQIKNSELLKNNTKWLEYFSEINFINDIVNISDILRTVPRERRENSLKDFILYLNKEYLPSYIYNPLSSNSNHHEDI